MCTKLDDGKIIFSKYFEADLSKSEIYYLGYIIKLTKREATIFARICKDPQVPVSAIQILDECFPGMPLTPGNINVHICNINKRARDIGERDIIVSVYGKGYIINSEH